MVRIKHAASSKRRKKRILKQTKGQFGQRKSRFRQAKKSLMRGLVYAFRDRKVNKRAFRRLWTVRINAACREAGISYSRFINGLTQAKVQVNRKMLAELAVSSPGAFSQLIKLAQANVSASPAAKSSTVKKN